MSVRILSPGSWLALANRTKLLWGLLLLLLIGMLTSPEDAVGHSIFLQQSNLINVLRQVSITGILAVGMTLVILTAGIDLSVGSVMAFGSTACAMLLTQNQATNASHVAVASVGITTAILCYALTTTWNGGTRSAADRSRGGFQAVPGLFSLAIAATVCAMIFGRLAGATPVPLAIVATLCMGWVIGSINGLLVARGGLQPFIATLAMMVSALGGARLMAGQDRSVYPIYTGANAPESFDLLRQSILGIPVPGLVFLAVVIGTSVVLSRFRFGRYIYAIGGNERAAFLSGIPVARTKIMVYGISGLLATLAGVLYAAQYRQGKPDAGAGMELDAIAAVVIGGTSLMGGRGGIGGTLVGVLIFGLLGNILQLNNVDSNTQLLLKGGIIVAAVLIQEGTLRLRPVAMPGKRGIKSNLFNRGERDE